MFRMAFALFYDTVIDHARKGNEWKAKIFGWRNVLVLVFLYIFSLIISGGLMKYLKQLLRLIDDKF